MVQFLKGVEYSMQRVVSLLSWYGSNIFIDNRDRCLLIEKRVALIIICDQFFLKNSSFILDSYIHPFLCFFIHSDYNVQITMFKYSRKIFLNRLPFWCTWILFTSFFPRFFPECVISAADNALKGNDWHVDASTHRYFKFRSFSFCTNFSFSFRHLQS